jgi:hypothetical protein
MKPDAIDDLLKAERGRKGFSTSQRADLWKGIASAIGPLPGGGGSDPDTKPDAAPRSPPAAAPPLAPAPAAALAGWKIGSIVALAAIGGAGVGAIAHARWAEPKIVVVDRAVEVPAPVVVAPPIVAAPDTPPPPLVASAAPVRAAPAIRASAATTTPAAPAPRDPGLARERTLLDMARTALSRGDSTAALSAADTHAREFPSSQLAEEREVLAIQALAAANRSPEARRRAAVFRMTYPKSALLPIVEEAAAP